MPQAGRLFLITLYAPITRAVQSGNLIGLTLEHHEELRGFGGELTPYQRQRIASLRGQYAHDPVALEQIAFYDPGSSFFEHIIEALDAYIEGDTRRFERESSRLCEEYPNLTKRKFESIEDIEGLGD